MSKPSKSTIDSAATGEGSLCHALRSTDIGGLSAAGQRAISDILTGRRSALSSVSHAKGTTTPVTLPPSAQTALKEAGPRRERNAGVSVTSVADIGELVKQARVRLGFNQQRFADLAGVGRRFVSELEAGKGSVEAERVLRCCLAAGIDVFARARQS